MGVLAISYIILIVINVIVFVNLSSLPFHRSAKFYSREDWGAKFAAQVEMINKPVPYLIIHHTAIPTACNTFEDCSSKMRSMQKYHMGMDWGDIGYNYCVGSEGSIYEGRGKDVIGIHTGRANNHSIGICLIGDWRYEAPPKLQLDATQELILLLNDTLSADYKLVGHGQVMITECPGTALTSIIRDWPYYSSVYP